MSVNKKEMETITNPIKESKPMKTYVCIPCNYITHNKALYNRHIITEKHKNNIKNVTTPSEEDIQKLEEKRISIINTRREETFNCTKCFTLNVSKHHLSNGKFCTNKIQYAQDLIKKHNAEMDYEDLLKEFTNVYTIKAFAKAFKDNFDLEPVIYEKQLNGKRNTPMDKKTHRESIVDMQKEETHREKDVLLVSPVKTKKTPVKKTPSKKDHTKRTEGKKVPPTRINNTVCKKNTTNSDDDDDIIEEKFNNYASTPVRSQRPYRKSQNK